MPSEEENRLIRVTRTYQAQAHQCKKLVNGMNAVQSKAFESHGGLKPQERRVDSIMGDDSGVELLQGCDYSIDKHSDFGSAHDEKSEHDHPPAAEVDKGSEVSMDLRNIIARQWRCPAFAWKALEAMPVRNLFRVAHSSMEQKPAKDADEAFVKTGDALLGAVEDGGVSERKLVTIVLAFQRWRHIQLKNILGQELRKVLEEAREDETALAALETELEHTEQQLATARSNSSRLRSQLAAAMNNIYHENGYSAAADNNTTVRNSDTQMMMRSIEGLKEAEAEIQRRDNQIQQMKERIRSLEDQSGRADGQLSRLQAERSNLQAENSSVLRENRALLEQLSSRDKEVIKQVEEMERLKALAARLVEQQNLKQHQIESITAQHSAQVKILQEQLQQSCGAKCSKEVELATSVEHCSYLKQEKDTLLLQLQEAEKRADLASSRAEELCTKLQCTTDDRAKASAEVASEMVKHLKKLTEHVRELETTVNATADAQPSAAHGDGSSGRYRILENTPGSSKPGCAEGDNKRATPEFDQVFYTSPQDPVLGLLGNHPLCPTCTIGNAQDQRRVSFSSVSDRRLLEPPSVLHHQHIFQHTIKNWITWKWRWAASSARAELLARKLHGFNQRVSEDSNLSHQKHQKVQELMQRLRRGNLTTCMENELNTMVTEHKLVPLILSAWRAFTRTSVLERKAISRSALLDKMLEALPWWIRRVRERRQLERIFFQWQVLTLSADRQPSSQQDLRNKPTKSKVVEETACYEDSQTPSKLPSSSSTKLLNRITRLDQLGLEERSDENAVTTTQRRPLKAPAANANQKRSLGDNGNQLSRASQTRALQALQTTLQQEVTELQKILCQEIQPLQRNTQISGRSATGPTKHSYTKEQQQPDGKKVLKSVLGVCNNLALALTDVRGKLSPRVLADTVNTCSRNERMKLNKGVSSALLLKDERRQFLEGQSPKSSPRRTGRPGKLRNSQAWEGWGTQIVLPPGQSNSYNGKKPANLIYPAQERRARVTSLGAEDKSRRLSSSITPANRQEDTLQEAIQNLQCLKSSTPSQSALVKGLEDLCSRYEFPFRSQNHGMPPKPKKPNPQNRIEMENTQSKDRCSSTTAHSLAPVQEIGRFKRGPSYDKRSPRTANPVLSISAIKKLLEDGAANASLEEKKLIGSAFARLLTTKISKLRGQAA